MLWWMVSDKSGRAQQTTPAGLVFVDIDNTLIPGATVFLFALEAWRQGFLTFSDVLPALFEQRHFRRLGESDERVASVQERALSLVKDHDVEEFDRVARATWHRRMNKRVFSEVLDTLRHHQNLEREVHMVSASPQGLVDVIAAELGFSGGAGTTLHISEGRFTGQLEGPLLRGPHKAEAAQSIARRRGVALSDCFALSDSIADLPLLEMVGQPLAVNPDQALLAEATRRGWPVLWPQGTHRYRKLRSR